MGLNDFDWVCPTCRHGCTIAGAGCWQRHPKMRSPDVVIIAADDAVAISVPAVVRRDFTAPSLSSHDVVACL